MASPERLKYVRSGKTFNRLHRLYILLEAFRTEAEDFLSAGHGPQCTCRFCEHDYYGETAAADLAGVLWAVRQLQVVWNSELVLYGVTTFDVTVHGRPMSRAEWREQLAGELVGREADFEPEVRRARDRQERRMSPDRVERRPRPHTRIS